VKRFSRLYQQLDQTTRTSEKLEAMKQYFRTAPRVDSAWVVYIFSGRKIGRTVSSTQLRQWAIEVSGYEPWLLDECFYLVGDLSETLSLIVPGAPQSDSPQCDSTLGDSPLSLHEVIEERLRPLGQLPQEKQRELVLRTWAELNTEERLAFHKLLSGNFRVGVSRQMMIRALAEAAGKEAAIIAHQLAGHWLPTEAAMNALFDPQPDDARTGAGLPYPFMLAHALSDPLDSLGPVQEWLVDWKWDGIRAQVIRRAERTTVWSRGDELVVNAFPEIAQAAHCLPVDTVLDGEILAWNIQTHRPEPFTRLQRRLNRLQVDPSFWPEIPVAFIAFDLLEAGGKDLRADPLALRRETLEKIFETGKLTFPLLISEALQCESWETVQDLIATARERGVEGVMLKRRTSTYEAGRPTGLWWKQKVDPYTVDVVMIAAEPGRGWRAGLLTDYTFGVWHEGTLVPVARAYSGFTNEEIAEVDRFARKHTVSKHGPVHVLEPLLVCELGFEAIQRSTRHKSGVALRFPRILRMRKDKQPAEADGLELLRDLLKSTEAAR
jgi:DNA ligase-1